jgi:hypothetical protein
MADSGSRTTIIIAVLSLTGVLGAAVISNWDKIFPPSPDGRSQVGPPGLTPLPSSPSGGADSPKSVVEEPSCPKPFDNIRGLPGDEILGFHVAELRGRELTIDVDYRHDASHEKVMIGAWLLGGVSAGYQLGFAPSPIQGKGRAQVVLSISEPGVSSHLEVFLYEYGRPAEPFACRVFPYHKRFE